MTVTLELTLFLAGSTLSIESNVMTVRDFVRPSDSGMSISTEELKSALKVSVNVVLFRRIKGVSMLKESLVRLPVKISRDSNNVALTLSTMGVFRPAPKTFLVSLAFRKSHDPFAALLVRTPVVIRMS